MWSNYYFYLMSLPEIERKNQIIFLIGFFVLSLLLGIVIELIKKIISRKQ